ncbi:MAG: flagellar hook assembly protein FlgD [Gallionella sp.]|nr:flagellar hook assembly protein FlgD [Gallionella sp.]
MINATTDTSNLFAPAKASTTAAKTVNEQDRFMTLLVAQMKNQDPLNPMDNAQMTSQLAQISTVSGIDKLNTTLQALSDSMAPNQTLQAASMIGHGVMVPGNGVDLANGLAYGGFELTQPVDGAAVSIYNQAGELVRSIDLGPQSSGLGKWQWDGKDGAGTAMPDGSYTFEVNGSQGGTSVAATGLQFGVVSSVTQSAQGVTLDVGRSAGVALSQVKQIL